MDDLLQKMRSGDRRALARLISLVEDRDPAVRGLLSKVYNEREKIRTIGITGPPGAGKSSLTDQVIAILRGRGQTVAIAAIDPSSPFTGGALLGDRIRMNRHATDEGVFIRSFGTRGSLGGLSHATREVLLLYAAAGFDWAVVETVGVGQTELDIVDVTDTTIVVLVPEAGDTVQTMKAGLTEIADVFVVNKSDREGAQRMKADLELMVHLKDDPEWTVPVLLTQANAGGGVPELLAGIERHREVLAKSPRKAARRAEARKAEFLEIVLEELSERLALSLKEKDLSSVREALASGKTNPYAAALDLLQDEKALLAALRAGQSILKS
ncbi:MAG: methylmalonyl Co-A mutase-associated GTPase MeaB [Bdellovibrionota bacterium]